jgi:hypothetical protein
MSPNHALDPKGFAAKANRRNNAETGNHAFKAILGDQIRRSLGQTAARQAFRRLRAGCPYGRTLPHTYASRRMRWRMVWP